MPAWPRWVAMAENRAGATRLALPSPCAPVIFFGSAGGSWFAVSGEASDKDDSISSWVDVPRGRKCLSDVQETTPPGRPDRLRTRRIPVTIPVRLEAKIAAMIRPPMRTAI